MTTDPQTAADAAAAAECVQTYLNGFDRVAAAHGGQSYVFSDEDIVLADAMRTLLAEHARMAAEIARLTAQVEEWKDGVRTQWGVWWPETRTVNRTGGEETARGWIREYAAIVGPDAAEMPRVMRRTVGAGPWQDADAAETAATRPADGTTDPAETQRTHTGVDGPQRGAQGDETDGGNSGG